MTQHIIRPGRRAFLQRAGALSGSAWLSGAATAAWAAPLSAPTWQRAPEAETAAGRVRGAAQSGCIRFLGVPFAQAPVGALRFASPRPAAPWSGTRDTQRYGAAPIQSIGGPVTWIYPQPQSINEDCLTLNVWTPSLRGKRPVLVWLYGGAFYTGYNAMPLTDGTRLATEGDMVVVAPNYRVGILGGAAHPDLRDSNTGESANWGLQDQIAALEWVHANIERFGGDPARVTVIGQSAGASSAAILAQHPRASRLFAQSVLLSMAYIAAPAQATADDQARYMSALADSLGTDVRGLRNVPALELYSAEAAFGRQFGNRTATGRGRYRWPVADGSLVADWPTRLDSFGGKPTLLGFCRTEAAFAMDLYDTLQGKRLTAPLPASAAQMRAAARALLDSEYLFGRGKPDADQVLDTFLQGYAHDGGSNNPGDALMALTTDVVYRHAGVRMAQRAAAAGNRQVFLYDFAHPLAAPARGTPHTSDIAFWFGSYADPFYAPKLGNGTAERGLSETMRQALASFVRQGRPVGANVPAWSPVQAHGVPQVMHFGAGGTIAELSAINDASRLAALDPVELR